MAKVRLILMYIIAEIVNLFIKPNPKYWLFSSSFNNNFNYNSKYFFIYIKENHPDIQPRFVINDDEKREALKKLYGDYFTETKSFKGIIGALRAGVWITSAGMPVYLLFSGYKRIVFNIWHGTPIKKIALLENGISFIRKLYIKCFFSRNYSYITTSSSKLIMLYSRSFGVNPEKIVLLGQPRNDLLNKHIDRRLWLRSKYENLPEYSKIILYAPTFREFAPTHFFPFADFNVEKLTRFLEEHNLIIFIRAHQSESSELFATGSGRIQYINSDVVDDINEVLSIFDLLITDYSSIYIDHLVTLKPQIFLPYDREVYLQSRGLNFDYDEVTPGPKPKTLGDFCAEMLRLLTEQSYFLAERKRVNDFFNELTTDSGKKTAEFINGILDSRKS